MVINKGHLLTEESSAFSDSDRKEAGMTRRSALKAAAWSTPVIATAVAAPMAAASQCGDFDTTTVLVDVSYYTTPYTGGGGGGGHDRRIDDDQGTPESDEVQAYNTVVHIMISYGPASYDNPAADAPSASISIMSLVPGTPLDPPITQSFAYPSYVTLEIPVWLDDGESISPDVSAVLADSNAAIDCNGTISVVFSTAA